MQPKSFIKYLICLLLLFTPLARGSVQLWAISVIHLISSAALCAFLMERNLKGEWKWPDTPLNRPVCAVFLLVLISAVFSRQGHTSLWAFTLFINYLVVFYLVTDIASTRSGLKSVVYFVISVALFLAVFGFFKRFGANPFSWWDYGDLKYSPDFLSSTFGNHNHLAGYMEMAIPLLLGFLMTGIRGGRFFLLVYIAMLLITALILSLSRGGWLAFIFSMIFMVISLFSNRYFKKRGFLALFVGAAVVLCFFILASTPVVERIQTFAEKEEEASFASRLVVWGGTVDMIKDYPVLGTGPGTYKTVFTRYQPPGLTRQFRMAHNDYLHIISETGLLFIPLLLWMAVLLFKTGFRKMKSPSRLIRGTTLGAMTGITAILFHSIVDFNLHIPANAILFAVLAALVSAPVREEKIPD